LRVPTDKFLEGVKKNETGLIKFGPAIQAVIDFAVDMEAGKQVSAGKYAKWTDAELKQKKDALAGVLKDAGFNDKDIQLFTSITGSPKEGYGEQAQFRDALLTGKTR